MSKKAEKAQELQQPVFLSRRQACARLGLSLGTLDALIRQGTLRAVRVGRRVLIRPDDLKNLRTTRIYPPEEIETLPTVQ